MKIILCIAENNGMLFGGRRVSQDSILRKKILKICNGHNLLMNEYSKNQFKDYDVIVDNNFLFNASDNDFCFVEDQEIPIKKVSTIYLFHWNRNYPADFFFNINLEKNGFKKIQSEEFSGSSHEKITLEIYERK